MRWERIKLSECCISIADGDHQPPPKAETGIPFVTISNINSTNKFDFENVMHVPQAYYDSLDSKRKAQPGDVLYSVVGSFGIPVLITDTDPFVFQRHIAILRPNNRIDPRFLYYTMLSHDFYMQADAAAIGAAQRTVSLTALRNMKIVLPPLGIQRRIADILSSYDNLIENNQKQIKLLEEAAQRLYKEWFVDLRFPGHENTPIVDGVPEGWKRVTVADCLAHYGNGGWGKETSTGKNSHLGSVIRGTDICDIKAGQFSGVPMRYHTDADMQKRRLQVNDIVFELSNGNINNIGRSLLIDELILEHCGKNTICASFCKLLRPKSRLHALILYWEIQDMQISGRLLPLKKHGANGINNFDFDGFLDHKLLLPANAALLEAIETIMKKIAVIQGQFALLTEARDRLLPKLMSGEIEV